MKSCVILPWACAQVSPSMCGYSEPGHIAFFYQSGLDLCSLAMKTSRTRGELSKLDKAPAQCLSQGVSPKAPAVCPHHDHASCSLLRQSLRGP